MQSCINTLRRTHSHQIALVIVDQNVRQVELFTISTGRRSRARGSERQANVTTMPSAFFKPARGMLSIANVITVVPHAFINYVREIILMLPIILLCFTVV